jgi:nucleoid-associated protein YgaU
MSVSNTPAKPEKGRIKTVDKQRIKERDYTPKQIEVPFLFNPTELVVRKSNTFTPADSGKYSNVKPQEFGGGAPHEITVKLFFDTYELHDTKQLRGRHPDVREYTDKLIEMMQVQEELGDGEAKWPPQVVLEWGNLQRGWRIPSYIKSMTQTFLLFKPDGTPVRATVDLSMVAANDDRLTPQNPTSGGIGSERTRLVRPGDRLDWIAYEEYGDSTRWRVIADANGLQHVRDLVVGQRLAIPSSREARR